MRHFVIVLMVTGVFLFFASSVYGIEEIMLQTEDIKIFQEEEYQDISSKPVEQGELNKSFKEKINNVFKLEVSDNNHQEFLLDEIMTKPIEKGILKNIGIWSVYRGALDIGITNDTNTSVDHSMIETRLHGEFKNNKTSFVITTRYAPQHEYTFMQYMFSDVFIRHKLDKHNILTIGNSRTHTGQEGGRSTFLIPFYNYSQISRTFGNVRKIGIRINGDYKLVDYDFGGYSSGTYFREFFPRAEFCGWVNFKPLGKTNGKYGDLKAGGGITSGRCHFNYNTAGGYIRYRYKKIGADFEIANSDGYNGRYGSSNVHARGFYTTLYYNLNKKFQLLARYDEFTPNCRYAGQKSREYSAGINYFVKGQALKFMLNYIFRQDDNTKNSHRIILGTQILL